MSQGLSLVTLTGLASPDNDNDRERVIAKEWDTFGAYSM